MAATAVVGAVVIGAVPSAVPLLGQAPEGVASPASPAVAAASMTTTTSTATSSPASTAGATGSVTEVAEHVYVGQFQKAPATKVVVLVSRDFVVAYACDNKKVASLVGGSAGAGKANLNNVLGAAAHIVFSAHGAAGTFALPGAYATPFSAQLATGKAGFYVADAATSAGAYAGRWVVEADGTSAGVLKLNGTIISNPPVAPSITISSSVLHPARTTVVVGFFHKKVFPNIPVYPKKAAKPHRRAQGAR